jgi:hypothetical protein
VYVDHEHSILTAQAIQDALNAENFGARVERDGATETAASSASVTSVFSFDSTQNDPPTTQKLTDFLKTFDAAQIETFLVDLPSNKIKVVHNPLLISAHEIQNALSEKTGIQAEIKIDGNDSKVWEFPDAVEDEVIEVPTARIRPTIIVSGVCWLISMLSFIGGNW